MNYTTPATKYTIELNGCSYTLWCSTDGYYTIIKHEPQVIQGRNKYSPVLFSTGMTIIDSEESAIDIIKELLALGMSQEQIDQLIGDFTEWSGGFTPEECDAWQITDYLNGTLPAQYDKAKATKILFGK